MKNEIVKIDVPELAAIEKSKAATIKATFEPMVEMLSTFEDAFNNVVTESEKEVTREITVRAKRLRLNIGKVRIQTAKLKDEQKAEYLRASNAIQGVHNIIVWAVTDKENKLKEIESFFEIQERNRLETLQVKRAEKLSKYVEDASERNLSRLEEDEFNALYSMKKKEYEDRIAAEKKAEEDRIAKEKAEAAERKRIAEENERLKKEAEEKAKADKIEVEKRAKAEADRLKKEEAERKVREEKERKEREAYEAKLRKEREEKERAEAELKRKQEAEAKAEADRLAAIEAELNKGDSDKVKDLINDLTALKTKYVFKSAKNKGMYNNVSVLIDKIILFIEK